MSNDVKEWLDIFSNFAVVGAFIFAAVTFIFTYRRSRKNDQLKIINEIEGQFATNEALIFQKYGAEIDDPWRRLKDMQYLNIWEWFSLLVNFGELDDSKLLSHYKPTLIEDYTSLFDLYPDLKDNPKKYEELKILYNKWMNA